MTKKSYNLVNYFSTYLIENIADPKIIWLQQQDSFKYTMEYSSSYKHDNPNIGPILTTVSVFFKDEKLETEFLLRFGDQLV